MTKGNQKLNPDTVLKNYWSGNAEFADLFNAVLFNGRQIIKPNELEDVDTEESTVFEHKRYVEAVKASRDNIKIQKLSTALGVQLVMLGLESQEHIHYAMPMRVMGYDYGVYKKQYDSNARKYISSDDLEEDEFLSKMKRTDRFAPVITVVVYYGEKSWDGAKSLKEMLDVPEVMKKYVNDYRLLLIEARQSNLVLNNSNNSDLFNLLKIVLNKDIPRKEAKDKAIQYSKEHGTNKNVVMTVAGATNIKIDYNSFERGAGEMCTLFEEIAKENREEGIFIGIKEGRLMGKEEGKIEGQKEGGAQQIVKMGQDFGLSDNDIVERLQINLSISLEAAQEYFDRFREDK